MLLQEHSVFYRVNACMRGDLATRGIVRVTCYFEPGFVSLFNGDGEKLLVKRNVRRSFRSSPFVPTCKRYFDQISTGLNLCLDRLTEFAWFREQSGKGHVRSFVGNPGP